MYEIMRKLRYEIPGDMTLFTGWATPVLGCKANIPDPKYGFFVCAMTAKSAGLLAELPEKLDVPCVSKMGLLQEELHPFFLRGDLSLQGEEETQFPCLS